LKKIRVGIIFGGKSAEHEVSLQSAKNVLAALDREKYEPVLIGIDKSGKWYLNEDSKALLNENNPKLIQLNPSDQELALVPGSDNGQLINTADQGSLEQIDVDAIFPVLHGTYGEDGTVQGMLKLANIPFVGAGVLGSAVGMDKDVMKRLLKADGIPVADFMTFGYGDREAIDYDRVTDRLGIPVFVKPANAGSSVGISKVRNRQEFEAAVDNAFLYDTKIIIEENIIGREIECSV
jgi:D-alanine-D-alanine ligase